MTEAPTTQERYARAVQSSSLRVEADVRGDADILIAAGWCKSKFGAALMRLQAEWDGAERWGVCTPKKPSKRDIMSEAQVTMSKGIRKITTTSMEAARLKLEKRYESELAKAVRALKTLPEVAAQLQLKLSQGGESADLAGPLLLYWLDSACKTCHGTDVQMPAARACGKCREHPGLAKVPGGDVGRAVLEHVNECASWASKEVRDACKH